jgi:addiction module RelE/StbE family toxin
MQIKIDKDLEKELLSIRKKDQKLYRRIEKQIDLFTKNPNHPSLRLHKLTGKLENMWSISIDKSIRMVFLYIADKALFVDIGTHDEVYKK